MEELILIQSWTHKQTLYYCICFICAGFVSLENQRKIPDTSKRNASQAAADPLTDNILCLTLASLASLFWEDFLLVRVPKY